jgi:hypothetical protein
MVTAPQRRNLEPYPGGRELGGCLREVTNRRFGTLSAARRSTKSFLVAVLDHRLKDGPRDWDVRR